MNSIYKIWKQRKALVMYWSAYLVVFSLIEGLPSGDVVLAFRNNIISVAPKVVFAVLVVDVLDGLLVKRKIAGFVFSYLLLLFAFALMLRIVDNYVILKYYLTWWHKEPVLSAPPLLYNAIKLQFLAAIPFIIKNFKTRQSKMQSCDEEKENYPLNDCQRPNEGDSFLLIKSERRTYKVLLNEILCLESQGNYIVVSTQNRDIKTYMSISEIEKTLPGQQFVRIHRSFIIATSKIEAFGSTYVRIRGRSIPIGRSYRAKVTRLSSLRQ